MRVLKILIWNKTTVASKGAILQKKALNKGKERSGSKLAVNGNCEEKKARGRVNKSNAVIKSALQRNQTFSSFSPVFECPASLNVIFV